MPHRLVSRFRSVDRQREKPGLTGGTARRLELEERRSAT